MSKLILGLFSPLNADLTGIFNLLQSFGEVRLIVAGQKNLGPIDLLFYPDKMGIIPTIQGLRHSRTFIPHRPINPHFYAMWNDFPWETIRENRGTPIVGMGDAAAMLYSDIGGKIIIDAYGNPQLLPHEDVKLHHGYDKDDYVMQGFSGDKVHGGMDFTAIMRALRNAIEEVRTSYDEDDDGDILDDVPVLPKPVSYPGKQ